MSRKTCCVYQTLAFLIIVGDVFCFSPASYQVQSQQSGEQSIDGIWSRAVTEQVSFEPSVVRVTPKSFSLFKLNPAALDPLLTRVQAEFSIETTTEPSVITLPLPDGSFGRFQIEESSIMEPELANRFPRIKSYKGKGLDDPTAHARFEWTPEGLHAMVLSASGSFLIDRIGQNETNLYASYFKDSLPPNPKPFHCEADPYTPKRPQAARRPRSRGQRHHAPVATTGNNLRVYRIAVAVTHRYVAAIHELNSLSGPSSGDLTAEALVAIHRTINHVNLVYETELNVRFVLVNEETKIIFTNAANDPYHDDADKDLKINQRVITERIGSPNFDIGHLLIVSQDGVGLGAQPCACQDKFKGQGLSGNPLPAGNIFDVQYVCHEVGHQLGASHSFNGTTAGCLYRRAATAYEPGSGSTIMGYSSAPGICGAETVQSTADPYFHAISLQEISSYITSNKPGEGDTCPRKLATTNNFSPAVDAGRDYSIPKLTPFSLAVGNATDGDGDALTFCWEEFDLGSPDPPHPGQTGELRKIRPIFRSFIFNLTGLRTFPALAHIIIPPTNYIAESLPANARTMTFRVTARDGRGRYGLDEMHVQVISRRGSVKVGPFKVTEPGEGVVWKLGSRQTIRWDVAGTRLPPIDCQLVRISILVRGDEAHPILLADNVSNNGLATINIPLSLPLTDIARVKIEAIGNIFFNVSEADIKITG